jgi:uncharacterized protein YdhG (YjbR/CyaY superfamily)
MKAGTRRRPETIDEYLATLDADRRAALERLRRIIRSASPKAEECISYRIPAFRLDGRLLVAFGAAVSHCAFYPGAFPLEAFRDELGACDTGKGTLRFQPDKPLPAALVRRIVKTRVAQNAGRRPSKPR